MWDPTHRDRRWRSDELDAWTLEALALLRHVHNDLTAPPPAKTTEPITEI